MRSFRFPFYNLLLLLGIVLTSFASAPSETSYRLIIFEGSDWCAGCRKLEKVIAEPSVASFLQEESIAILRVDFPQRLKQSKQETQHNDSLAIHYGFEGVFPTLVLEGKTGFKKFYYENEKAMQFQNKLLEVRKLLAQN